MHNYGNWPYVSNNMMVPGPSNKNTGSGMPNPWFMQPNISPDLQPGYTPHINHEDAMQPGMGQGMMQPGMMQQGMSPDMMQQGMMQQGMSPDMMQDEKMDTDMSEALELIKEAIKGEIHDRLFYQYLLDNAPALLDKEIIEEIRDNEIKHAKMFRQLYFELTGQTVKPDENVSFEKPSTYCDGLRGALMGETSAVKKYRRILAAMTNRKFINMMVEIITDELRHASLYNLLIHNNDCKY